TELACIFRQLKTGRSRAVQQRAAHCLAESRALSESDTPARCRLTTAVGGGQEIQRSCASRLQRGAIIDQPIALLIRQPVLGCQRGDVCNASTLRGDRGSSVTRWLWCGCWSGRRSRRGAHGGQRIEA